MVAIVDLSFGRTFLLHCALEPIPAGSAPGWTSSRSEGKAREGRMASHAKFVNIASNTAPAADGRSARCEACWDRLLYELAIFFQVADAVVVP
jgi:hypothetical protein